MELAEILPKLWVFDFETKAIKGHIPPEPVGLAVRYPNGASQYFSWGHPDSPRPTRDLEEAKDLMYRVLADNSNHILCHNSKFDMGVSQYHWQLGPRNWTLVHDTVFLLFFNNPYSKNLSLKPSSEELLNWPPEEQDTLTDWIMANTSCTSRKESGAYISEAPHDIVSPYAIGDVQRTLALFTHLYPKIAERGMLGAYRREQKLVPILYEGEQRGVRIARPRLEKDLEETYEPALAKVEDDLRRRLKTDDLEFSKKDQLADALERGGYIGEWIRTPTGRRSVAKDNLEKAVNDSSILHLLRYRGAMAGVLQTFGRPWLVDTAADGRLHTSWNQVRTRGAHDDKGARTGRMSASRPNLMNIPNELKIVVPDGYPAPPFMRQYMLPEEGHRWLKRDFSSQEVRWLAHFEDGELMVAFQSNPGMDPHEEARQMIFKLTGVLYERKQIKITAFSIIYGAGYSNLAGQLGVAYVAAVQVKDSYLVVFPSVKRLQKSVTKIGKNGGFITTWGGRQYYAEPSIVKGGRTINFAYKLLNYLIQGSAADQTKESLITWDEVKAPDDYFLCAVHDEVNISAPEEHWENSMAMLRESMDAKICDVPMKSEGYTGLNWFDLERYD